jgi:hypothetical protein
MSPLVQVFVSVRPQNHSRFSALGPRGERPKTGSGAAVVLTREDEVL